MIKRSMWLVSFALIVALALAACGGDDDDDDEAAAAPVPTSTPKSEPVAVQPTAAVPTAAAVPVAMLKAGASYADILAGDEIGDIDSDIFNKNRFGGVLKWVPQGSVGNLDSMMSGSAIGRGVVWHFWELLIEWDDGGVLQPDLLDSWTVKEDASGAHYTFVLRDGRKWHDGGKPLPSDVEATTIRYLEKDTTFGPTIEDLWVSFETVDEDTFIITLTQATPLLVTAFGYVGGTQFNIMPKAIAEKYPKSTAEEFNGSGPYRFVSWDPGNEIILDRFDAYVPRTEQPAYRAGAKMGYFARMITIEIPDQETRVAAVLTGEVDSLDVVSGDFYEEALKGSDKVSVHIGVPGAQPNFGFNVSDPLIGYTEKGRLMRLAIQAAVNAEEIMKGYGDPTLWTLCASLLHCGTPWEEPTLSELGLFSENNPEKAKALLKQAGYAGEEIIIMDPTDFPTIHPIALPLKEQLEAVGINIKIKAVDWAGDLAIYGTKEGWHLFTAWSSSASYHPLVGNQFRTYKKDIADAVRVWGYPVGKGYENGDKMEQLRTDFAFATSREEELAIAKKMGDIAWSDPRWVNFGAFFQLRIYDKDIMDADVRGHPVGSPMFLNQWWGDAGKRAEDPR